VSTLSDSKSGLAEINLLELPSFVRRFVHSGDRCFRCSESPEAQVLVRSSQNHGNDLLHARLRLVTRPKEGSDGDWFVRANLHDGSAPKTIVIEGEALVRYFYRCRVGHNDTLYSTLGVNFECTPSSLRFAWRGDRFRLSSFARNYEQTS